MIKRITFSGHNGIEVLDEKGHGYFVFHNPDAKEIPHICVAEVSRAKDKKLHWRGTFLTDTQKKRGKHFKRLYVNNSFVPELIEAFRALTEKDRVEKKESDVIDDFFNRGNK